ncbi:MAG: hypothetical protein ACLRTR_02250 [Clostridia bacterium]|jgi:hypothetical protein
MKEKRYFCDFWNTLSNVDSGKGFLSAIGLWVIVWYFICCILNTVITAKYGYELGLYKESTYNYLYKIAENVIQEGKGLNLSAIPDDVVKYEIIYEGDEIIFKYYLDNNKDAKLVKSASMTVIMSNEIEIIFKTPNYSSENEFRHCVEENMMTFCLIMGGAMSTIFLIVAYLVCVIVAWISYYNKTKNLS